MIKTRHHNLNLTVRVVKRGGEEKLDVLTESILDALSETPFQLAYLLSTNSRYLPVWVTFEQFTYIMFAFAKNSNQIAKNYLLSSLLSCRTSKLH